MGRPASGAVAWENAKALWSVRVTLANGRRSRPVPMPDLAACVVAPTAPKRGCSCVACCTARERGKEVSKRTRDGAHVDVATEETANEWFRRYIKFAKESGQTDTKKKATRWNKWIAPTIGMKPMALVTRDDVEDIRDGLDRAIDAWKRTGKSGGRDGHEISGKTAMNVWSCLTSSFKAATSSKRRDLRVLHGAVNPCVGVEPPGDRDSRRGRRKTFLYPREAAALLACPKVPLAWREVYAVALYTYLRPGELRILRWADIDPQLALIHVTKAWDYAAREEKPPKTRNGVRHVPIEPTLVPLLRRLREGRKQTDLVLPEMTRFGEDHLAKLWRRHLLAAGINRVELHNTTRTHVQSNFRSCRDSGLTWLALAGVEGTKIMRRAGHDLMQTTMGYVKMAEDLAGDLGVPFGPLPEGPESSGGVLVFRSEKTPKPPVKGHARRDSNPRHAASKAAALSS